MSAEWHREAWKSHFPGRLPSYCLLLVTQMEDWEVSHLATEVTSMRTRDNTLNMASG